MTIRPKTPHEIDLMREGGAILNRVLESAARHIQPGKTLKEVDAFIHTQITEQGAKPSFLNYRGFPASSCLSVNEAVVHGIPTSYVLKEGDCLGVDVGVYWQNYHTDAAITLAIGAISPQKQKLIDVSQTALKTGIESAIAGNSVGDIGHAIESSVKKHGHYGIIRDLSGHGIGTHLQEEPQILNYTHPDNTPLVNNMTLAIEPMISIGDWHVEIAEDGWTVLTKDHSPAAHFETTIVIVDNDPEVLVTFPIIC